MQDEVEDELDKEEEIKNLDEEDKDKEQIIKNLEDEEKEQITRIIFF